MIKAVEVDLKQKGIENLILLVLGSVDKKISLLHLEKEIFLLWNFHPKIKQYLNFIKHYKGPFSKEIQESLQNPLYLENCWIYNPPKNSDKLSGGYFGLTDEGRAEYEKIVEKIKACEDYNLMHLLAGIKMVRELYDKLSMEELLLLIYDTYPDYKLKSSVYNNIEIKKKQLIEGLIKKGLIDEKRFDLFSQKC